MEKVPNLVNREKTKEELDSQVNRLGTDLYPPSANKGEILNLSETELKNKYTRRYEIYKKLLKSTDKRGKNLTPEELTKMRKWLNTLNSLDTYIYNHNEEIEDSGLWDRQFTVFEDIREFLEKGGDSGYVKLPTRFGKTVIFTKLIEALAMKTVIVVPSQYLVDQTEAKISQFASDLNVGKVYGKAKEFGREVTITTYNSLVNMVQNGKINPKEVDCLILDEVHRGLSEMRSDTIRQFEHSLKLGFSATPSFSETKGADKLLITEIHSMSLEEASAEGLISPFSIIVAETDVDISNVKILSTTGDYSQSELSKAVNLESRNRAAIELYKKMFLGKKAIVNCVDIKHAEDFNKEALEAGIHSRVVSSANKENQEQNVEDYRKGELSMLVNINVLNEGFDDPKTSVCLNLRPTFSRVVAEQRAGRVLTLDETDPSKQAYIVEFLDKNNVNKKKQRSVTLYDVVGMTESYLSTTSTESKNKFNISRGIKEKQPQITGLKIHVDPKEVLRILKRVQPNEKNLFSSELLQKDFMDDRFISLNTISANELKNVEKSLEQDLFSQPISESNPSLYADMREKLFEALTTLTSREEKVIKMRFFDDMTLEEVGLHFGVGKERVRQIEGKALRKLRHPARTRKLEILWGATGKKREEEE